MATFKIGDRVKRNPKVSKAWRNTPATRDDNHGIVVRVEGHEVWVLSDAEASEQATLKPGEWGYATRGRGFPYQVSEILPE